MDGVDFGMFKHRGHPPVAHKPPGAGSSLLSSKGFSAAAGAAACTDLNPLQESGSGSVRHEQECTLPAVLFPVSLPA